MGAGGGGGVARSLSGRMLTLGVKIDGDLLKIHCMTVKLIGLVVCMFSPCFRGSSGKSGFFLQSKDVRYNNGNECLLIGIIN